MAIFKRVLKTLKATLIQAIARQIQIKPAIKMSGKMKMAAAIIPPEGEVDLEHKNHKVYVKDQKRRIKLIIMIQKIKENANGTYSTEIKHITARSLVFWIICH